jgi:glutamyl-tRNA synthetase
LAKGEPPIYDRAALKLTSEEKAKFEAEGIRPHYRFKLKPGRIFWHDHIKGDVEFQGDRLSDPVLVRADGAYLYTLTSVVDDIDFDISHIIRGEDHVTNTSVQIQLFEAITGKPTSIEFAHFTLFLDKSGQALSKRLGSLSLESFRSKGLAPMAINSLLARLGTSLPVEPVQSLEELALNFDLKIFSKTAPHFDDAELDVLNHKLLTITPYEAIQSKLPSSITETIWTIIRGNLKTIQDIAEWEAVFSDAYISPLHSDVDYVKEALDLLPKGPLTELSWKEWTDAIKAKTNRKGRELFMPLRQALTGHDHGPEMKDLLPLIGHDNAIKRLRQASGQA